MLFGVTLVVDIIAVFDVFVDYVIVVFLIVVADHTVFRCGH